MESLTTPEKLMIRGALLFVVIFCLAAPPVGAAVWPFGGSKKEENAVAPAKDEPKIFMNPKKAGKPGKKGILDGILNKPQTPKSVMINGKELKNLRPEMMTASYTPKSADEIMLVAYAHKSWEGDAIAQKHAANRARAAAAQKKSDAALAKMQKEGALQMVAAQQASNSNLPSTPTPEAATAPSKPAPVIYNKPSTETPTKVFKNYR